MYHLRCVCYRGKLRHTRFMASFVFHLQPKLPCQVTFFFNTSSLFIHLLMQDNSKSLIYQSICPLCLNQTTHVTNGLLSLGHTYDFLAGNAAWVKWLLAHKFSLVTLLLLERLETSHMLKSMAKLKLNGFLFLQSIFFIRGLLTWLASWLAARACSISFDLMS